MTISPLKLYMIWLYTSLIYHFDNIFVLQSGKNIFTQFDNISQLNHFNSIFLCCEYFFFLICRFILLFRIISLYIHIFVFWFADCDFVLYFSEMIWEKWSYLRPLRVHYSDPAKDVHLEWYFLYCTSKLDNQLYF